MVDLILPDRKLETMEGYYPNRKPVGNVRVDPDHWLAPDLIGLLLFNKASGLENLVTGKIASSSSAQQSDGSAVSDGSISNAIVTDIDATPSMTVSLDYTLLHPIDRFSALVGMIFNDQASGFELVISGDGVFWWASITDWNINATGDVIGDGDRHIYTYVHDEFSGVRVYIDGILVSTSASAGALTSTPTSKLTVFGRGDGFSLFSGAGIVHSLVAVNRALSTDEVGRIADNPYQLVIPT